TRWARLRYERTLAARSAVSTAAYLALVTPPGPAGAGYDLARLLIRSRALEELPGLHARVEVYHGTAPLVHATAPGLPAETLDALRRRPGTRWQGDGALAPLFDRQGWDVVGAVATRADVPEALLAGWLAAVVAFALVAGGLAVRALGGRPDAVRPVFRRYARAPGGWAEVRAAPDEAGAGGWFAAAFGVALLGPLGVAATAWGVRAAARPRYLRETAAAWVFLAPSGLLLVVFSLVPLLFAGYL